MGKFNTLRTTLETAKMGKEFYDANHDAIHGMGKMALAVAGEVHRDGFSSTARSMEQRYNTPENQERLRHVTREMGGAALKGAALEMGVINSDGKVSKWGAFKALLGLKTGTTYVRAAKGAARGVQTEARSQAYGLGNEFMQNAAQYGANYQPAGDSFATTAPWAQAPSSSAAPNPFGPPSPSSFNTTPAYSNNRYSQPWAAPSQYQPNPFSSSYNYNSGRVAETPPQWASGSPQVGNPFGPPPSQGAPEQPPWMRNVA